jgi:chromate reductase, NAD(P)H dehydrogenase (quinone)
LTTIVGISGSLRRGSYNAALLRAAAEVVPEGVKVAIAPIHGIPLYNADVEAETGPPDAVVDIKNQIAAADGLLLVTPEYNNGIPGVFKNAIDWLSRPVDDVERVFGGRAVALMGATPGRGGTRLAQAAWLPVLRALGTRLWTGEVLYVTRAGKAFDEAGKLVDERVKGELAAFMAGFAAFVAGER